MKVLFALAVAVLTASAPAAQENVRSENGIFCETEPQAKQMMDLFLHGASLIRAAEVVNRELPADVCTFREIQYQDAKQIVATRLWDRAVFIVQLDATAWRTSEKAAWVARPGPLFGALVVMTSSREL